MSSLGFKLKSSSKGFKMNIIIIGLGIAGLSTAIALKQKGFDVTIYERHQSVQTIAAGIVFWSNASYVLNELHLLEAVKKVSSKPKNMHRFSDNGEALGSLKVGSKVER